jgi:hypothetical protein
MKICHKIILLVTLCIVVHLGRADCPRWARRNRLRRYRCHYHWGDLRCQEFKMTLTLHIIERKNNSTLERIMRITHAQNCSFHDSVQQKRRFRFCLQGLSAMLVHIWKKFGNTYVGLLAVNRPTCRQSARLKPHNRRRPQILSIKNSLLLLFCPLKWIQNCLILCLLQGHTRFGNHRLWLNVCTCLAWNCKVRETH